MGTGTQTLGQISRTRGMARSAPMTCRTAGPRIRVARAVPSLHGAGTVPTVPTHNASHDGVAVACVLARLPFRPARAGNHAMRRNVTRRLRQPSRSLVATGRPCEERLRQGSSHMPARQDPQIAQTANCHSARARPTCPTGQDALRAQTTNCHGARARPTCLIRQDTLRAQTANCHGARARSTCQVGKTPRMRQQ